MSGYTDQEVAANAETVLYKPFEFSELGRRLRSVLDAPPPATTSPRYGPAAD